MHEIESHGWNIKMYVFNNYICFNTREGSIKIDTNTHVFILNKIFLFLFERDKIQTWLYVTLLWQ
jgi:hypothetical protein